MVFSLQREIWMQQGVMDTQAKNISRLHHRLALWRHSWWRQAFWEI